MLMTKMKPKLPLLPQTRVFLLCCHGCREIGFPEEEAKALRESLAEENRLIGEYTADYLCNPAFLKPRLADRQREIEAAEAVLVLSCGVGVQTVADLLEDKRVLAGCDTVALPGFQGVTPLEYDCGQCGQCFLNLTGGICPITACSKGLLNGPCGGARAGKCEVSPEMDCGWERILEKLRRQGRLDALQPEVQLWDFGLRGFDGKIRRED